MKKYALIILNVILISSCLDREPERVVKIEDGYKKVGYFLNGKLHGSYSIYDSLENLVLQSYYENGVINGKHLEYYSNGNIMFDMYFKKGKRNGVMKHYQRGGELWEYIYYINDSTQYAKIYNLDGGIVHYYAGAEVEMMTVNDSLRINASLIHSNLESLETGIILYGNSKQDTIRHEKGNSKRATLTISKDLFDKYDKLSIEVCEIENRFIYARCDVPLQFSNLKNKYHSEWSAQGFKVPDSN